MCHSEAMGAEPSVRIERAWSYRREALLIVSSRCISSSRVSADRGCAVRSVQSSAAARATLSSLLTIETALASRDRCDNALAAARISANSGQSAAT